MIKKSLIIKKISLTTFKRFFELTPYILTVPKIFVKFLKNFKYFHCLSYYLKYSYSFFKNYNFPNLLCFSFFDKISFLKNFSLYFKKYFNLKINNLYFDSFSFIHFNFLIILTSKKFLIKLKQLFLNLIKYLYTFIRYFNNK